MNFRKTVLSLVTAAALALSIITPASVPAQKKDSPTAGSFQFEPLPASAQCTNGGNPAAPFLVPEGYAQTIVASEPSFADAIDMNTLNETGPQSGRFLYRPSEGSVGEVTVTDLKTGVNTRLAFRPDWERMDTIAWTPWGTLLVGEEATSQSKPSPDATQAQAGLMYELFLNPHDPTKLDASVPGSLAAYPGIVVRPALGSKAHEGSRFDAQGNYYGISESNPGYVFRFIPDRRGDLSSGQLYALKVTVPNGDRTGEAVWEPLDRATVQVNANTAAAAVGATGYNRPEDVETATSTGSNRGGSNTLYVAITGASGPADERVIAVDLREPEGGSGHDTAFVYDYVRKGLNAPADFQMPDNLALDKNGNLYITEDPSTAPTTGRGDDIWVATPNRGGQNTPAVEVVRFASLTDCQAEPTGIYFDKSGTTLFVNAQHRGGDTLDKAVAITRLK
jgi:hypothetical protein